MMTDNEILSQFTQDELDFLKSQNGVFTFNEGVLYTPDDVPEELLKKLVFYSREYVAGKWLDPSTRYDSAFHPDDTMRQYLALFGLTDEKASDMFEINTLQPPEKSSNTVNMRTGLTVVKVVFGENPAQFVPTLKEWAGALSPQKNKKAYIAKLDNQLRFIWNNDGSFKIDVADEVTAFDEVSKSKPLPAKEADTDLLYTLASAVEASYISACGYIITVRLPDFARAMNVQFDDESKNNHYDFKKKLTDLENIIGVLVEQKKIEAAFKILSLDQTEKTLTFASPYLYSLMKIFEKERIKSTEKRNNEPLWNIKGVSRLVSTRINSARNKVTAQIVYYIVAEIHRHGNTPDSKKKPQKTRSDNTLRTKKIMYSDIVKYTPLLKESLKEAKSNRRNQILNRAIFGDSYNKRSAKTQTTLLEDYLRKYTKIFEYWNGLEISFEPVSMKDLDHCITITHHGINGDFTDFYNIPKVEEPKSIFEDE